MQVLEAFAVLGVPQSASVREIDAAWRCRARAWHPDRRPGDPRALRRMKALNAARRVARIRARGERPRPPAPVEALDVGPRSTLDPLVAMEMPRDERIRGLLPSGLGWEIRRACRFRLG